MQLTKEETETVIRCSAADQEWDIVTADPRFIRHLEKKGYKSKPDHQLSEPYVRFTVPFTRIKALNSVKRAAPKGGFNLPGLRNKPVSPVDLQKDVLGDSLNGLDRALRQV